MPTGNEQYIINQLNSMTINDARHAIASGQFGSIGRPDREFAIKYLASKEASEQDKREAESLSISRKAIEISEEANRIAEEANLIAERALSKATRANIWAAIATLIAAIAIYIKYI